MQGLEQSAAAAAGEGAGGGGQAQGRQTVAERVEDANTMAVLRQLGIEFIQGYFVNAPRMLRCPASGSTDPGARPDPHVGRDF